MGKWIVEHHEHGRPYTSIGYYLDETGKGEALHYYTDGQGNKQKWPLHDPEPTEIAKQLNARRPSLDEGQI